MQKPCVPGDFPFAPVYDAFPENGKPQNYCVLFQKRRWRLPTLMDGGFDGPTIARLFGAHAAGLQSHSLSQPVGRKSDNACVDRLLVVVTGACGSFLHGSE